MDLVDTPFSPQLPVGSLHWLIADETGSITVEAVKEGLMIYDNPAGVLTNNPPFPQQMFQLNNYMHLSPRQPVNTFSKDLPLKYLQPWNGRFRTSRRSVLFLRLSGLLM